MKALLKAGLFSLLLFASVTFGTSACDSPNTSAPPDSEQSDTSVHAAVSANILTGDGVLTHFNVGDRIQVIRDKYLIMGTVCQNGNYRDLCDAQVRHLSNVEQAIATTGLRPVLQTNTILPERAKRLGVSSVNSESTGGGIPVSQVSEANRE